MTTLKVTLPTNKAGQQSIHTIEFDSKNFDQVIDSVCQIKTISELQNSKLWSVK